MTIRAPLFLAAALMTGLARADGVGVPDVQVHRVLAASGLPKLVLMRRSVELSTVDEQTKKKLVAIIDPLVDGQQKLIDEVKLDGHRGDENVKKAADAMHAALSQILDTVPPADRSLLTKSEKVVLGEGLIFDAKWPLAGHRDPLPNLVMAVGLDDKQQAALAELRTKADKMTADLVDQQTAVAMAPNAGDFDQAVFRDQLKAVGTVAARAFRESLTADQQAEYDDWVRATFPMKRPARV